MSEQQQPQKPANPKPKRRRARRRNAANKRKQNAANKQPQKISPKVDSAEQQPKPQPKPRPNQPLRANSVVQKAIRNFVACHRCDHFFGGYRAHVGLEKLTEEVNTQTDGWLSLTLDDKVRRVVAGAYGYAIPVDTVYFSGRCEVCARLFELDEEIGLRVQASPRVMP